MPSRYHPIEDGLWDDPKFDATTSRPEAPGDTRGFFAFLATNKFQRLPGVYRATDGELACAYRWPVRRVTTCLKDLSARGLIVRDGSWIFLPGYLKRQAHNPSVLKSSQKNLESCTSSIICASFVQHYPLYRSWCRHGEETVCSPTNKIDSSEQSRAEQSRAVPEQSSLEPTALVDQERSTSPTETPEMLMGLWNDAAKKSQQNGLPGLRLCRDLNETRKRKAGLRLREAELAWHAKAIGKLAVSRFACGGGQPTDKHPKPFRASFGWYVANDENCLKAYEGTYDD